MTIGGVAWLRKIQAFWANPLAAMVEDQNHSELYKKILNAEQLDLDLRPLC